MEVSIDPSEMEALDEGLLKEKYEESVKEKQKGKEDLSEVLAEKTSTKKKKKGECFLFPF